jgi:hypothetical protein
VLLGLYGVRATFLKHLSGCGPIFAGLALALVSLRNLRLSLFMLGCLLFLGAYPALEFQPRHYFHLEFLTWWAIGFVLQQAISVAVRLRHPAERAQLASMLGARRPWTNVSGLCGVSLIVLLGPLLALRVYQREEVGELASSYLAAPRDPVPLTSHPSSGGTVLLTSSVLQRPAQSDAEPSIYTEYLVTEWSARKCGFMRVTATFAYEKTISTVHDYSRTLVISLPRQGSTLEFFPAYDSPYATFQGISLPASQVDCLVGVYKVIDLSRWPLLLNLSIPPDWKEVTLYQTLKHWEARVDPVRGPNLYSIPADLPFSWEWIDNPPPSIELASAAIHKRMVRIDGTRLTVRGEAAPSERFAYLFRAPELGLHAGTLLLGVGHLVEGGFAIGLVQNRRWVDRVVVAKKGEFALALKVPADGTYSLVVANALRARSLMNDFTITRVGLMRSETPAPDGSPRESP